MRTYYFFHEEEIMKEASINARIPSSLKDQVTLECTKKGISMTAYVIRSLTHELHGRGSDAVVLQELTELRSMIDSRITEYKCDTNCDTDVSQSEVKDLQYYLKYIQKKQETHGNVTEPLLRNCAKKVGITFTELLHEISEEGIEIVIL